MVRVIAHRGVRSANGNRVNDAVRFLRHRRPVEEEIARVSFGRGDRCVFLFLVIVLLLLFLFLLLVDVLDHAPALGAVRLVVLAAAAGVAGDLRGRRVQ